MAGGIGLRPKNNSSLFGYLPRLQVGLVDRLGGLSDAIAEAKLLAGLPVDVDQVCWVS